MQWRLVSLWFPALFKSLPHGDCYYLHVISPHRLASTLFLTLAELYSRKKPKPHRRSERRMSSLVEPEVLSTSKVEKGGWDQGGKENYLAWCMVKSALKVSSARHSLQGHASAASSPELTKPLSERVLQDLPDFVLLDLYPQCKSLEVLANRPVVLPIESLLLSRQFRPLVTLNWFKIISYYNKLVQRCSWQKVSLGLSDSDWGLRYNYTTPLVFVKTKAVHDFLCVHCHLFRTCVIPILPQLSMLPMGGVAGSSMSHREPHLTAGEMDVTIVWYTHPVPSSLIVTRRTADEAELVPASDRITGYFAMNLKSVNFPVHSEPHALGMETHVVHTSLSRLSTLHDNWKALSGAMSAYLESKAAMRPTSRSLSKQRRAEKNLQPPEELMKGIAKAVKEVASFFESKAKEVGKPCLYHCR